MPSCRLFYFMILQKALLYLSVLKIVENIDGLQMKGMIQAICINEGQRLHPTVTPTGG